MFIAKLCCAMLNIFASFPRSFCKMVVTSDPTEESGFTMLVGVGFPASTEWVAPANRWLRLHHGSGTQHLTTESKASAMRCDWHGPIHWREPHTLRVKLTWLPTVRLAATGLRKNLSSMPCLLADVSRRLLLIDALSFEGLIQEVGDVLDHVSICMIWLDY
jgi:hypothetical protein